MIDYGKPASNQMQLEGMADGCEEMKEARQWVGLHFSEWCRYKEIARAECACGNEASPNFVLQSMRHRCKVSVKNAMAPYLARIAMEEDPSIRFRTARSKADGWTGATL